MEARARRGRRPALVRLPDAPHVRQRALPGLAGRAVVSDRANRGSRARPGRNRRSLVARPPGVRHAVRRCRRRCRGRRVHDPRRVFACCRDRRTADARGRSRPRVARRRAGSSSQASLSALLWASSTRVSFCSFRWSSPVGSSGEGSLSPVCWQWQRFSHRAPSSSCTATRRGTRLFGCSDSRVTVGSASSTTTSRRSPLSDASGKGSVPRSSSVASVSSSRSCSRTRADLILSSFVIVYFADLLTLSAHFDRYVLPLVPALGALAGRMRSLAPVTLLLLVVPLTWSIRDTKQLTRTDTRIVAHRWVEQHIGAGTHIAADPSTPAFAAAPGAALALAGPEARLRPEP